ncbi:hypothetical protein [Rhodococcus sp. ACT016]|uniref:hypothetical protein n=1 Tax=Rhodococcus sp. ACT016 TaxID=3134808 RepID=UPI003D26B0A4
MKTTFAKAALAGTAMTAAIVMGAGSASAAVVVGPAGSAGTGTPTADYQVCGTAYVGADTHVGAPPADAKAVGGVKITGQLYDLLNSLKATYTTTTASDGTWCLQGDEAMANTVTWGGKVKMSFDTPTVGTYTGKMSGGTSAPGTDASINSLEFLSHGYPTATTSAKSAWKVNVVYQ